MKPCCERDHNGDGNCDRHPDGNQSYEEIAEVLLALSHEIGRQRLENEALDLATQRNRALRRAADYIRGGAAAAEQLRAAGVELARRHAQEWEAIAKGTEAEADEQAAEVARDIERELRTVEPAAAPAPKRPWLGWLPDYPDEGGIAVDAATEEEARELVHRRLGDEDEPQELTVRPLTADDHHAAQEDAEANAQRAANLARDAEKGVLALPGHMQNREGKLIPDEHGAWLLISEVLKVIRALKPTATSPAIDWCPGCGVKAEPGAVRRLHEPCGTRLVARRVRGPLIIAIDPATEAPAEMRAKIEEWSRSHRPAPMVVPAAEMDRERLFPILGGEKGAAPYPKHIPWWLAAEAYGKYSERYGTDQSLETMARRGGFAPSEMDLFRPGWREAASGHEDLRAAVKRQREALQAIHARCASVPRGVTGSTADLARAVEGIINNAGGDHRG